MNNKDNRK